jgi:hypothetical protein
MLKMRVSVMELGRFTAGTGRHVDQREGLATTHYPPPRMAKAMKVTIQW